MTTAFLNNAYMPLEQASISPMDRGFLFGDGIYEVIPTHYGKPIGLQAHLSRMSDGLAELQIDNPYSAQQWQTLIDTLIQRNRSELGSDYIGVYLQITRGTVMSRQHAYPQDITPTVFGYGFTLAAPPATTPEQVTTLDVALLKDRRWERCHIKSTSLLGNVMHFEQGKAQGKQEAILLNAHDEVTEASSCNVFVVWQGDIYTPPLDYQLLPGITRKLVIESLAKEGIAVYEQVISKTMLLQAQEVWLTSSSKEITPVTHIDEQTIGEGQAGPVWEAALAAFNKHKFTL
ncbi:aminotransferase class IV [Salinimonas marina]|uniref:Aminodeoxychorismate lyase n=1 Tax=Salinimonas marina TaxID=2785918 RepID=A0A7S9DUY2_9ALTE|nr:aminotransferase class IV [Salinimonas marina]QPG04437.1 aminotransferase class IV [Salinimonas marina]